MSFKVMPLAATVNATTVGFVCTYIFHESSKNIVKIKVKSSSYLANGMSNPDRKSNCYKNLTHIVIKI